MHGTQQVQHPKGHRYNNKSLRRLIPHACNIVHTLLVHAHQWVSQLVATGLLGLKGNPLHGQHAHTVAHKSAYNSQAIMMSHANAQHTCERAHPSITLHAVARCISSSSCRTTAACRCSCMQEASTSSGLAHDPPMTHTRHTRHRRMVPWDTLPTQHTSSTTHTPVDAATQNADAERHKQTQTPPAGAVTSPSKPQPLP
jgi:hypothetical protein